MKISPMHIDDETKSDVIKQFESLKDEVKLLYFTQTPACNYCAETRSMLGEISGLSEKIVIEVYDFVKDKMVAESYHIDKIPAIVVMGQKDYGIRFYGIPSGYEFQSLIEAIIMVSTGENNLSKETRHFLDILDQDIHLQVFVTPTCPYCPSAVKLAHKLAFYSDKVKADMIESVEFPHLGSKYKLKGVPRTVINEKSFQDGAAPEVMLIDKIRDIL